MRASWRFIQRHIIVIGLVFQTNASMAETTLLSAMVTCESSVSEALSARFTVDMLQGVRSLPSPGSEDYGKGFSFYTLADRKEFIIGQAEIEVSVATSGDYSALVTRRSGKLGLLVYSNDFIQFVEIPEQLSTSVLERAEYCLNEKSGLSGFMQSLSSCGKFREIYEESGRVIPRYIRVPMPGGEIAAFKVTPFSPSDRLNHYGVQSISNTEAERQSLVLGVGVTSATGTQDLSQENLDLIADRVKRLIGEIHLLRTQVGYRTKGTEFDKNLQTALRQCQKDVRAVGGKNADTIYSAAETQLRFIESFAPVPVTEPAPTIIEM